jgi:pimeloyl-ACP methyl ester carboxylesterase
MKVIVENLAIEYEDSGRGAVVLALHGWGDSHKTFDPLIAALGSGYRVVRLDLPGFGGSEAPHEVWELEDYIRLVETFVNKEKLAIEVLIGHSFGGRIAVKGVAEGALKPSKIILIASAGIIKSTSFRNRSFMMAAKTGKALTLIPPLSLWRRQLRSKLYDASGSDFLSAGPLSKTFLKIVAEDLLPFASRIKRPTLLIWGSDDAQTPLEDGKKLSAAIDGSELFVIPGAAHFVHHEQPNQVAAKIKEFIS